MFDWCISMTSYFVSDDFTAIVNVISVIGFFITIFVWISVYQIKSQYTSRIRVPELKGKLVAHTSQIGEFLNDYTNNKNQILLELSTIEPILKAIKKRLGWNERSKVNETIKMVNKLQKNFASNEEEVRLIYNHLHGINSELEQWEIDKNWSA
jgi:hypothetical protein